mmetsp:Transcript_9226/g.8157  ORF Transcript_9226/g.8157 Transcript_9226/m.8157 type:complete len:139 (+) Transcript_9226:596-1012(+)
MERTQSTIKRNFTIARAPKILSIHLNRLADFDNYGNMVKNNNFVTYGRFLDLSCIKSLSIDSEYELKSVVVHYGSAQGGHYVTLRKVTFDEVYKQPNHQNIENDNMTWMYVSDNDINFISLKDALAERAYMLFYERIN